MATEPKIDVQGGFNIEWSQAEARDEVGGKLAQDVWRRTDLWGDSNTGKDRLNQFNRSGKPSQTIQMELKTPGRVVIRGVPCEVFAIEWRFIRESDGILIEYDFVGRNDNVIWEGWVATGKSTGARPAGEPSKAKRFVRRKMD